MEVLLDWAVIGVLVPFAIAVAIALAAMSNTRIAKAWFAVASGVLAIKLAAWAFVAEPTLLHVGMFAAASVLLMGAGWASFRWADTKLTRLIPGHYATPPIPPGSNVPDDALIVFLGSNLAWATAMPYVVIKMGGREILMLDRVGWRRLLTVSVLRLFDDQHQIIARIDPDEYWTAHSIRIKRPNASTLVVYDRTDKEVLHISLLNKRALFVRGIFRHEGVPDVVISDDYVQVGPVVVGGNVFGGLGLVATGKGIGIG